MSLPRPYSTQLLAFSAVTTEQTYTVPSGHVAVVRDIDVANPSGTASWAEAAVYIAATGANCAFWVATSSGAYDSQQWRGRQVVNAGDSLVIYSPQYLSGVVSGYLLQA